MTDLDLILLLHRALRSARPFVVTGHHRGSLQAQATATVRLVDSVLVMADTILVESCRKTMDEIYAKEAEG